MPRYWPVRPDRSHGSLDAHRHLAAIAAGEEADQRLWRLVEAVDDIDDGLDLPFLDPERQLGFRLGAPVVEIHDDEAFQARPLGDDQAGHGHRTGRGFLDVVLRDVAATDN